MASTYNGIPRFWVTFCFYFTLSLTHLPTNTSQRPVNDVHIYGTPEVTDKKNMTITSYDKLQFCTHSATFQRNSSFGKFLPDYTASYLIRGFAPWYTFALDTFIFHFLLSRCVRWNNRINNVLSTQPFALKAFCFSCQRILCFLFFCFYYPLRYSVHILALSFLSLVIKSLLRLVRYFLV